MGKSLTCSYFSRTASFVSESMQSKRRITVRGRITSPYSCGLYTPVSLSAIAHIKLAFSFICELKLILNAPLYNAGSAAFGPLHIHTKRQIASPSQIHPDISNNTFKEISKSTHWYRKAKCATKFEDKLLYSWIALESILKVSNSIRVNINPKDSSIINVAKVICSSVMARNKFYSYANNMYTHLVMTTQQFNNYYGFTSKTIESAKLNIQPGDKIELTKFFVELPRLIAEINDEIFKRDLIALQSFYEDKKCIIDFKSLVSDDVTLIYRLRNMIVHNAVCPEFIIKLYAYKAQYISGSLIQAVRYHYNKHGMDIGNTLLKIYSEYQILESNISSEIKRLKVV